MIGYTMKCRECGKTGDEVTSSATIPAHVVI